MKDLLRLLDHLRGGCIRVIGDQRGSFQVELLGDRLEMVIDSDLCTGSKSWNRDDLGENSTETTVNQTSGEIDQVAYLKQVSTHQIGGELSIDRSRLDGIDMWAGEDDSTWLNHLNQVEQTF